MGFRTNSSKASEGYTLKPEGNYEVLIENAEIKEFTRSDGSKTTKISFRYVIRNDVDQKFQDGKIFHDVWKKREPNEDDLSVEGFNYGQLMAIANAASLPDGQDYESLADFLTVLTGKPVKVHLYHDSYNGKKYEKVDEHMETEFPQVKHKPKAPANPTGYAAPRTETFSGAANAAASDDADDDYPF